MHLFSDMAMQICNKRVTHVTTNLLRQLARPVSIKTKDDHHQSEHIDTPKSKTLFSMNRSLLNNNASIVTGLNCMLF